jgi:hypothetical protein
MKKRERFWKISFYSLVGYSLIVLGIAKIIGLHSSEHFNGLWQKPNWLFFPLYWYIIFPIFRHTWDGFIQAWLRLVRNGVVRRKDGERATYDDVKRFLEIVRKHRVLVFAAAIFGSIALNIYDIWEWAPCYLGNKNACSASVPDFNVAWHILDNDTEYSNLAFTVAVYLQQVVIGVLVLATIFQVIYHLWAFSFFEKLGEGKSSRLEIKLDHKSGLHEFGLETWNNVLNNLYWLFSIAFIIPLISRYSQPDPSELNNGQLIFQHLLPIAFLIPMIVTIIQRQARLPSVWVSLKGASKEDYESYHNQRIWPLDKNWASKLGLLLSMIMLSYLLGSAAVKYESILNKILT